MQIGSYNNVVNQLILPIISNPILFALVFLNFERNIDCTRQRRETTNINYWHKKFCDLKPQIEKIKGKITVVKILQKNKEGQELSPGNLRVGDIYVGTTEGVYLIRDIFGSTRVEEFDDLLNFSIKNIVIDEKGNAYALSNNNIYYLRYTPGLGWSAFHILIGNSKKNIINMKEILKNSNDNYLKAGDIYVQTDNGNYLIHNNQQTEKITTDKNYFINHNDNNITTVHFNNKDNSYCHSTGKKLLLLVQQLQ